MSVVYLNSVAFPPIWDRVCGLKRLFWFVTTSPLFGQLGQNKGMAVWFTPCTARGRHVAMGSKQAEKQADGELNACT